MSKFFSKFDWVLFLAVLVLLILGLFVLASVFPDLFFQQVLNVFLGLAVFFLFARIDYLVWERLTSFLFLGSVIFLLLPSVFGTITRGAVRWVQLAGLTIQPSEIAKPFLILFFAWFFNQKKISLRRVLGGGLLLALPILLIFRQPDLGSCLILAFGWLGMVLASGLSWVSLALIFLPLMAIFPLIWFLLKEYQQQRLLSFLNPAGDPLGAGYHLIQATVAVGAGQFWGRGFGQGTQSHLRFLPERQTDFIFASFAEEMGFLGSLVLAGCFLVLLWRVLVVAREAKDQFGFLLCLGVFSLLFFQIFVNLGMNLGLVPITGVTLPLVSYGGSSLVSTFICLGLAESVACRGKKREVVEIR